MLKCLLTDGQINTLKMKWRFIQFKKGAVLVSKDKKKWIQISLPPSKGRTEIVTQLYTEQVMDLEEL